MEEAFKNIGVAVSRAIYDDLVRNAAESSEVSEEEGAWRPLPEAAYWTPPLPRLRAAPPPASRGPFDGGAAARTLFLANGSGSSKDNGMEPMLPVLPGIDQSRPLRIARSDFQRASDAADAQWAAGGAYTAQGPEDWSQCPKPPAPAKGYRRCNQRRAGMVRAKAQGRISGGERSFLYSPEKRAGAGREGVLRLHVQGPRRPLSRSKHRRRHLRLTQPQQTPKSGAAGQPKARNIWGWLCGGCGNPNLLQGRCTACQEVKTLGAAPVQGTHYWRCRVCSEENKVSRQACMSCFRPRDEKADLLRVTAPNGFGVLPHLQRLFPGFPLQQVQLDHGAEEGSFDVVQAGAGRDPQESSLKGSEDTATGGPCDGLQLWSPASQHQ